jgi:hypothetical protein
MGWIPITLTSSWDSACNAAFMDIQFSTVIPQSVIPPVQGLTKYLFDP